MTWPLLVLLACEAPAPPTAVDLLGRPPSEAEAAALVGAKRFVAIEPDAVLAVVVREPDPIVLRVPLIDGRLPEREDRRIPELIALFGDGPGDHEGPMPLLVERSVAEDTLLAVLHTAAWANIGTFRTVLSGTSTAPPPAPKLGSMVADSPPDESTRPDPSVPVRLVDDAYRIDDRGATFRVELVDEGTQMATSDVLADLLRDADNPYLYPSFAAAESSARYPVMPSLEMFVLLSKSVEERAMLRAYGTHDDPVRARLIDLGAAHDEASVASFFQTAQQLQAGEQPEAAADFLEDPVRSRPLGMWAATPVLQRAFVRDRWLAQPLPKALMEPMRAALQDADLRAHVDAARAHQARWTNPPAKPPVDAGGTYLLPPARSPESTFMEGLDDPSAHAGDAFVEAIKGGDVSLAPRPDAGLHDRHVWALEPLLVPQDGDPTWSIGYERRLERAFLVALAARRETQVKDLYLPSIGASMSAKVGPDLRVEPVPAHYRREAEVYDWLLSDPTVDDPELHRLVALYRSLAATSEVDLGRPADASAPWDWRAEPSLAADTRRMVPVAAVPDGVKVWAILGVTTVDIAIHYVDNPKVQPLDPTTDLDVTFVEQRATLLVPKLAELTVPEPLDRATFRALADRHPYAADLRTALAKETP